jgi:hypothetical protein
MQHTAKKIGAAAQTKMNLTMRGKSKGVAGATPLILADESL